MDAILFNHCSPAHSPNRKHYGKGGKKNNEDVDENHNKVFTKIKKSFYTWASTIILTAGQLVIFV